MPLTAGRRSIEFFIKRQEGSQGMPGGEPWFVIYCEEGILSLHGYERLVADGEVVYEVDDYDPWHEQDRVFAKAVSAGDALS